MDRLVEIANTSQYFYPTYELLIESAGLEIVDSMCFGAYQGDEVVLVKKDDKYGILIFGYGSCTGCDALQAAWDDDESWEKEHAYTEENMGNLIALRDSLVGNIRWTNGRLTLKGLVRKLNQNKENYWYMHDTEIKDYVKELAVKYG